MRTSILAITVLALLFAGCMGGGPAADDGNATDGNMTDGAIDGDETDGNQTGDDTDDGAMEDDGTTSTDDGSGTFELLISDQQNAIGDFDSLEVTFSQARIFSGGEEGAEDETDDTNETETDGNETDAASVDTNETDDGDDGQSGFETVELGNASVDLTTVVGANATAIGAVDLAPGTYNKVELHVASVDGVVDNESADVKVPSEKLMITKPFTVEAGSTTGFVFDISVVEKGGGQGYNLLPVVSESGVAGEDVDVERKHDEKDDEHDGAMEGDDGSPDDGEHSPDGGDDAMESDDGTEDGHDGNTTDDGSSMNASA